MNAEGSTTARQDARWIRGWVSDSGVLLTSQALTVVATTIAAITVARTLDPDEWGLFSAFLGLSAALALVADFGLGTWLLRELSQLPSGELDDVTRRDAGELLGSGLVINVALAAPLILAAVVWSVAAGSDPMTAFALVSLLSYGALVASANALEAQMRSRRLVGLVFRASFVEKVFLVILLLGALIANAGFAAIGLAYVLAGFCRLAIDIVLLSSHVGVSFVVPRLRKVRTVARASLPLALNTASLNVIPRFDTFVLVAMSTTAAAWFAIGDRALGPALLIPAVFASTLYPFLGRHGAQSTAPWRIAIALGLVGGVLATVGMILAPLLIPLLFGDAYADAVPVVRVMLFALPLIFAASPLLVYAYSSGRERSLLAPIAAISLAGTGAIVLGQALGGAQLAAAGYVFRQCLFLFVVGVVAIAAWRKLDVAPTSSAEVPEPGAKQAS